MDEEFNERKDVSAEDSSPPDDCPGSEPVAQRRADALARVAEGFLGGEAGSNGGERSTIHVHADLDILREDGEGAEGRLDSGAQISAETFLRCGTKTARLASISNRTRRFRCGKAKKWTWVWRLKDSSGWNLRLSRQTGKGWIEISVQPALCRPTPHRL